MFLVVEQIRLQAANPGHPSGVVPKSFASPESHVCTSWVGDNAVGGRILYLPLTLHPGVQHHLLLVPQGFHKGSVWVHVVGLRHHLVNDFDGHRLEHRMQWKIHNTHTCSTNDVRSIGHGELRTHFHHCMVDVDVIFPTTLDLEVDRAPWMMVARGPNSCTFTPSIADGNIAGSKGFSSDQIASILLSN